jgi:SEC-C motif-containing protein
MREPCPCDLGHPYPAGCGRFHAGDPAPTAVALMRSRYAAFALGMEDYLRQTWHPSTRPARLDLDPRTAWTGLTVHEVTAGSAFHTTGTVRFTATFATGRRLGSLTETSHFTVEGGRWFYVDGVVD